MICSTSSFVMSLVQLEHGSSAFLITVNASGLFINICPHAVLWLFGLEVCQGLANPVNLCRVYGTLGKIFRDLDLLQHAVRRIGVPLALFIAPKTSIDFSSNKSLDWIISEKWCGENHVQDGRVLHDFYGIPKCMPDALRHDEVLLSTKDWKRYWGNQCMQ